MTIAVGGIWAGQGLWRRLTRHVPKPGDVSRAIDYRVVGLGALIPDAIDKPFYIAFPRLAGDDHSIGHTLLFSAGVVAAGLIAQRLTGDARLIQLGLGSLCHPLVDPVVACPHTLLWPLFGTNFPEAKGIPGWYLRALDAALVAVGAIAWRCSPEFRERFRRFVRTGAL